MFWVFLPFVDSWLPDQGSNPQFQHWKAKF